MQTLNLKGCCAGSFKNQTVPPTGDIGDLLIRQPGQHAGLGEIDIENDQAIEVTGGHIPGRLTGKLEKILIDRHDVQGIFVRLMSQLADEIAQFLSARLQLAQAY